jgi:excisionase family DNA binding protein
MGMNGVAEYLTPQDAAFVLGCSSTYVRALADDGRLKVAARTVGTHSIRLFLRAEVERFAKARASRKAARQ